MREKTGAWAPDIVVGEEGEQKVTNTAFRPRWREQLWGQGGEREILLYKNYTFFCISVKIRKTVSSVWPGAPPRQEMSEK